MLKSDGRKSQRNQKQRWVKSKDSTIHFVHGKIIRRTAYRSNRTRRCPSSFGTRAYLFFVIGNSSKSSKTRGGSGVDFTCLSDDLRCWQKWKSVAAPLCANIKVSTVGFRTLASRLIHSYPFSESRELTLATTVVMLTKVVPMNFGHVSFTLLRSQVVMIMLAVT